MIVTLSSSLDVTNLEVDRIRVRERRVLRSKTTMKAHEEKEVKMIEVNEAIRGDGPQLIAYLDSEVYIIRHGRMEKLRKFKKSIITR